MSVLANLNLACCRWQFEFWSWLICFAGNRIIEQISYSHRVYFFICCALSNLYVPGTIIDRLFDNCQNQNRRRPDNRNRRPPPKKDDKKKDSKPEADKNDKR